MTHYTTIGISSHQFHMPSEDEEIEEDPTPIDYSALTHPRKQQPTKMQWTMGASSLNMHANSPALCGTNPIPKPDDDFIMVEQQQRESRRIDEFANNKNASASSSAHASRGQRQIPADGSAAVSGSAGRSPRPGSAAASNNNNNNKTMTRSALMNSSARGGVAPVVKLTAAVAETINDENSQVLRLFIERKLREEDERRREQRGGNNNRTSRSPSPALLFTDRNNNNTNNIVVHQTALVVEDVTDSEVSEDEEEADEEEDEEAEQDDQSKNDAAADGEDVIDEEDPHESDEEIDEETQKVKQQQQQQQKPKKHTKMRLAIVEQEGQQQNQQLEQEELSPAEADQIDEVLEKRITGIAASYPRSYSWGEIAASEKRRHQQYKARSRSRSPDQQHHHNSQGTAAAAETYSTLVGPLTDYSHCYDEAELEEIRQHHDAEIASRRAVAAAAFSRTGHRHLLPGLVEEERQEEDAVHLQQVARRHHFEQQEALRMRIKELVGDCHKKVEELSRVHVSPPKPAPSESDAQRLERLQSQLQQRRESLAELRSRSQSVVKDALANVAVEALFVKVTSSVQFN